MTYEELKSAILSWTEEDGNADLEAELSRIISLAEDRIFTDVPALKAFKQTDTGVLTQDVATYTLPSARLTISDVSIVVGTERQFLQNRQQTYLEDYWPDETVTGVPVYYARTETAEIKVAPTPAASYAVRVRYRSPLHLSDSVTTTWLSENADDLLLTACLVEAERFLSHPEGMQAHEARYQAALAGWKSEERLQHLDEYTSGM